MVVVVDIDVVLVVVLAVVVVTRVVVDDDDVVGWDVWCWLSLGVCISSLDRVVGL